MTEFDSYTRQQPGITDLAKAQQAVNIYAIKFQGYGGASGVGFDILSTLVTQSDGFCTLLEQEIGETKQVSSTAEDPGVIGVKVDSLTSDVAALTIRIVDQGVTRLQTYYGNCTAHIRHEIGNNKAESDQKWVVKQTQNTISTQPTSI
mgnify:CR=1 FL=1